MSGPQDKNPANLPAIGYVRLPAVAAVCGISTSAIWKWCRDGRFPPPVKLAPRVSAWSVDDLRAWLADPQGWKSSNAQGAGHE